MSEGSRWELGLSHGIRLRMGLAGRPAQVILQDVHMGNVMLPEFAADRLYPQPVTVVGIVAADDVSPDGIGM